MSTGYIFDKRCIDHELCYGHPESPERLIEIEKRMKETGLDQEVKEVSFIEDPMPLVRMNHSDVHIASVQQIPTTGPIAELVVSGILGAVQAVSDGNISNAFCAIRPPGHHAHNSGGEEGFCFYNNIAIAAKYAQTVCKHEKILIIDWDYHHGNGTEWSFYEDPSVLFFSTHHWFAYPGTGDPSKQGAGDGHGFNINVPLQPGATDDDIKREWEKKLLPKAAEFKPDFIFISAGFDSRVDDLLGCFSITDDGFALLTRMALTMAETYCNGRLISTLEGGYNVYGCAKAATAHVGALVEGA